MKKVFYFSVFIITLFFSLLEFWNISSQVNGQTAITSGLTSSDSLEAIYISNPTIDDVQKAFTRIRTSGDYMAVWANDHIRKPWYTTSIKNKMGFRNHFQGIARLPNKNYLVVSGSNVNEPMSSLYIIKLNSCAETGDWTSNIILNGQPPLDDGIVKTILLDSVLWHAGDLGVMGDILTVPIYGGKPLRGKIIFYNVSNPQKPQKLDIEINRPAQKAYAVTLVRLTNGFFLVAVLSDRDILKRRLDFYLSKSTNLLDGFEEKEVSWFTKNAKSLDGKDSTFSDYQSINFIKQSDGRLFLLGLHNTIPSLRIIPGKDYGDLYEVKFPGKTTSESEPILEKPEITKIARKQFYCKDGFCNMDAGAGLYISDSGEFSLYAVTFWLEDNKIKFTSFSSEPDSLSSFINDIQDAWIDFFEDENFEGHRLTLFGPQKSSIPDYENIYAQEQQFNKKISSVRFQIPIGFSYRLYEAKDYQGKYIDLNGTGKVQSIKKLEKLGFDNRVSSSRYIHFE